MSKMVERVARALCKLSAERSAVHNPGGFEAEFARLWRGFGGQAYIPEARAAIAAMREPTEAMVRAGDAVGKYPWAGSDDESTPKDYYLAMIAAALKED